MEIKLNLTFDEYIILLVAVENKMQKYKEEMEHSTKYYSYWEENHEKTASLLSKIYEAENPPDES